MKPTFTYNRISKLWIIDSTIGEQLRAGKPDTRLPYSEFQRVDITRKFYGYTFKQKRYTVCETCLPAKLAITVKHELRALRLAIKCDAVVTGMVCGLCGDHDHTKTVVEAVKPLPVVRCTTNNGNAKQVSTIKRQVSHPAPLLPEQSRYKWIAKHQAWLDQQTGNLVHQLPNGGSWFNGGGDV